MHFAWRNTPVNEGGIGQVSFPMVSDITKQISRDYDVLFGGAVALRGSFIIDEIKSCDMQQSMTCHLVEIWTNICV